jgi:hypothetical protein
MKHRSIQLVNARECGGRHVAAQRCTRDERNSALEREFDLVLGTCQREGVPLRCLVCASDEHELPHLQGGPARRGIRVPRLEVLKNIVLNLLTRFKMLVIGRGVQDEEGALVFRAGDIDSARRSAGYGAVNVALNSECRCRGGSGRA